MPIRFENYGTGMADEIDSVETEFSQPVQQKHSNGRIIAIVAGIISLVAAFILISDSLMSKQSSTSLMDSTMKLTLLRNGLTSVPADVSLDYCMTTLNSFSTFNDD